MMLARLVLALALVLPVAAAAQAPAPAATRAAPAAPARPSLALQMLAGSWALRVEDTVVFRFDLVRNGEGWSGAWLKPKSFATDGAMFTELTGPPEVQRSQGGRAIGEWAELSFGDVRPGAIPDVFRFRLIGPDRAEMLYVDTGQAPFVLERVDGETMPGAWSPGQVYRREGVRPGMLVTYNVGPRTAPSPQPTARPPATERQPAIIGR